jgi:CDP-glucose 4,6-dehydratase
MINDYKKTKVFVTGATGFKGSWLFFWLKKLGANVHGIGLQPEDSNILLKSMRLKNSSDIKILDINNFTKLSYAVKQFKPDIIFHLAAQSIVSNSFENPLQTLKTNVIGSANILEIATKNKLPLVMITSDKCYKNKEWIWPYRENDTLGGDDPYSASKASAELVFNTYYKTLYNHSKYLKIATTRAGNVIGGGDMKANRIVPDIFKAIFNKKQIHLRNPQSTRPWQHVLEPLFGYLILGMFLLNNKLSLKNTIPNWNFGPEIINCKDVKYLTKYILNYLDLNIPIKIDKKKFHEQNLLMLDNTKAKTELNWSPKMDINSTLEFTTSWYINYKNNINMYNFTHQQIEEYLNK